MDEQIIKKIRETLDLYADKKSEDYWEFEIYCDYNDEFSDSTIAEFMKSENPRQEMEEKLFEYSIDYDDGWLRSMIKEKIGSEVYDENYDEINEFLNECTCFYYPEDHFNKDVYVNIMVDTGDGNHDFVMNSILNYCNYYTGAKLQQESSICWLAKQQGKKLKLDKAIHKVKHCCETRDFTEREIFEDKFVESVIQELENLPNHMSTLTFLVKIPLFQLFELHEAIKAEEHLNKAYDTRENRGTGHIVISKNAMCGLFSPWNGGGSVLEIELEKDVNLPIKYIFSAMPDGAKTYGYDVGDTYGLCGSAWRGEVKEIHAMKGEAK